MDKRFNHAVLLFFAAMFVVHGYVLWSVRGMVLAGYPDFTSFYAAGESVRQGHGNLLYDANEQWNTQQAFAQRVRIRKGPLPYLRLPFEAVLFVPFSFLPYPAAYALWGAFNIGVVVAVSGLLRRHVPFLQKYPGWLPAFIALAFTPVFLALLQGQDSILLLFVYSMAYVALREGKDFRAGCFLGLGLFKPHLVFPFVLIAFLHRKRMVAAGFVSVCIALFLVSLRVAGWSALLHYPGYIWWLERHTGRGLVLPRDTPNLRGLVEGSISGFAPAWVVFGLTGLLSAGVIFWATARTPKAEDNRRLADLAFCQAVIATFLVSYHAFAYDLSILLLPIFLLAAELTNHAKKSVGFARFALVGPPLLLLFGPIYAVSWLRLDAMNLLAVILLLWMWGIARAISQGETSNGYVPGMVL